MRRKWRSAGKSKVQMMDLWPRKTPTKLNIEFLLGKKLMQDRPMVPMGRLSLWAQPIQLSSLLLFRVFYVYVLSYLSGRFNTSHQCVGWTKLVLELFLFQFNEWSMINEIQVLGSSLSSSSSLQDLFASWRRGQFSGENLTLSPYLSISIMPAPHLYSVPQ